MLFNSYGFVFAFLLIFLAGFYGLRLIYDRTRLCFLERVARLYLVASSLIFFAFFGLEYQGVFLVSILCNLVFIFLQKKISKNRAKLLKILFVFSIIFNVFYLGFFKYARFFAEIFAGISDTKKENIVVLPLAISFYTFSQISMQADLYRGKIDCSDYLEYLTYITFFPKLLQGPIMRFGDFKSQTTNLLGKSISVEKIESALSLFVLGLAKKSLLADTLAAVTNFGYSQPDTLSSTEALVVIFIYPLQLYFDFSGYCDMAMAIGRMVGIELPNNFNSPFKSRNIDELWKRWHMTLTSFFTEYVYIPLGGGRKGEFRTYVNFIIIFLVSGFWHGAGLGFILWGALHALAYVLTRFCIKRRIVEDSMDDRIRAKTGISGKNRYKRLMNKPFGIFFNYLFVAFTFSLVGAGSIGTAISLFRRVFGNFVVGFSKNFLELFMLDELWYIIKMTPFANGKYSMTICMWIIIAISFAICLFAKNAYEIAEKKLTVKRAVLFGLLFVWSVLAFSEVSTYIYMGF